MIWRKKTLETLEFGQDEGFPDAFRILVYSESHMRRRINFHQ